VDVALFEQEPQLPESSTVLDAIFNHRHPVMDVIKEYEAALDAEDEGAITTTLAKWTNRAPGTLKQR
jgi:ATP-binding cassette subfamily F protein uup